jgi:tetratricopeptide (TPR) repeat protein
VNLSNLQALIAERLKTLEDQAQLLLPWAAALGRQFEPMLLAQIADCPLHLLLTALEQLEIAGIIRPRLTKDAQRSDRYEFAHDVLRQVVYETTSAPRQRLMHRQIAQHLDQLAQQNPDLISAVAHHAGLGGHYELAATASLQAAQQWLQVFAFAEAVELTQQGLNHCRHLDRHNSLPLQMQLLKTQVLAGVSAEAVPIIEEALQDGIRDAQAADLQDAETDGIEALLMLNYNHDRLANLHTYSLDAVDRGQRVHPSNSARILALSGSCLTTLERDIDRAEAVLLEAQSLAERVDASIPDIPYGLGCVCRFRGDLHTARQFLTNAYQIASTIPAQSTSLIMLTMVNLEVGAVEAAIAHCQDLITLTKEMGEGSEAPFARALHALAHYILNPENALPALESAIQELHIIDAPRKLAYVLSGVAEIDLTRGRTEQALAYAAAACQSAHVVDHPSDVVLACSLWIQALIATQQLDTARQELHQLYQDVSLQELSARSAKAIATVTQTLQQVSHE